MKKSRNKKSSAKTSAKKTPKKTSKKALKRSSKKAQKTASKKARTKTVRKTKTQSSAKQSPAPAVISQGQGSNDVVDKQPQVKDQAAVANGMFLYTDDAWSLRYFDQNDLHFKEREVFG